MKLIHSWRRFGRVRYPLDEDGCLLDPNIVTNRGGVNRAPLLVNPLLHRQFCGVSEDGSCRVYFGFAGLDDGSICVCAVLEKAGEPPDISAYTVWSPKSALEGVRAWSDGIAICFEITERHEMESFITAVEEAARRGFK